MKRAIALLLAMAALGAAGLAYTHRTVSGSAEAVEMYETVLSGDRAAAEGLEICFPTECMMRFYWNTTLSLGAENKTETDFSISTGLVQHDPEQEWNPGIWMNLGVSDNVMGESGLSEEHELYAVVSDVASRAPSGAAYSESVRLGDYYGNMPLFVNVDDETYYYEPRFVSVSGNNFTDGQRAAITVFERQLRQVFAIPVPEDYYLNVSVEKASDGELLRWSVYPQREEQVLQLDCVMAASEQGIWFAAHLSGGDGGFECDGTDKLWYRPSESADGGYASRAGELVCVMDLYPGEQAQRLDFDVLGRPLMLTDRDGEYYLRVIDGSDGHELQALSLPWQGEDDWVSQLYTGENFLMVKSVKDLFTFYELTENGEYVPRLNGELRYPGEDIVYSDSRMVLRWDGRRLAAAVVAYPADISVMRQAKGFVLWVYDDEGLALCARYDSSLSMAEPWAYIGIESYKVRELSLR